MNFITGCSESSTVEVTQDANIPSAVISPISDISCIQPNVILSGTNSTGVGTLSYEWTNNIGQVVGMEPNLTVSIAGNYSLQVTDDSNDCFASTSIVVESDIDPPVADAGMDGLITCADETFTLNAANSSQGLSLIHISEPTRPY